MGWITPEAQLERSRDSVCQRAYYTCLLARAGRRWQLWCYSLGEPVVISCPRGLRRQQKGGCHDQSQQQLSPTASSLYKPSTKA